MATEKSNVDFNQLSERILAGIAKANRKMAENAASNNQSLIVADKDGKPVSVPAKELLKNLAH
ncbi:MAG: hypothetical protein H7289_15875 [Mucilaginibacter sp.]|nr:hypothetical protein [Mucilaginibacter sp.]